MRNKSSYASILNVTKVKKSDKVNKNSKIKEWQNNKKLAPKQKSAEKEKLNKEEENFYDTDLVITPEEGWKKEDNWYKSRQN